MDAIPGLGVVIVAGGSSTRYGNGNKLFENLGGLPVFLHSVKNFSPAVECGKMVLVVPAHENAVFRDLLMQYLPEVEVHLVSGGSCRTESVKNGLAALPPDTRIAAIHDAARPLAGLTLLSSLAETVMRENCGAIAAEKMVDSVCRTDGEGVISESVSREGLWRIQTPQVFLYREICSVYARLGKVELTDDSAAARSCGCRVKVCANAAPNPKLTYKEDLPFLEHLLKKTLGTEN